MQPDTSRPTLAEEGISRSRTIFLTGILPEKLTEEIHNYSKGPIQSAADALQKSVITGFIQNQFDFEIINLPYIGGWPNFYKKVKSPASFVEFESGKRFENISFYNIRGYKMWSRYRNAYKALKRRVLAAEGCSINILVYAITTPLIKAALKIKHNYNNVKVIVIAPDLPEYMGGSTSGLYGYFHKLNNKILRYYYDRIDAFVVLTKQMSERLLFKNQPYTVVEGIYNPSDSSLKPDLKNDGLRILLYTGSLAERYGIVELVDAVHDLQQKNFVLEIYGAGDAEDYIEKISSIDDRIKFSGQVPRPEILKRQKEAYLLINPRSAKEEFTKYSFPSKTMEYLASGTPTLMHRLPGMPEEYEDYFFEIQGEGKDGLKASLNNLLNMDYYKIKALGEKARDFILTFKNPKIQTQRIINLINSL